jgi:hypothetical protein
LEKGLREVHAEGASEKKDEHIFPVKLGSFFRAWSPAGHFQWKNKKRI